MSSNWISPAEFHRAPGVSDWRVTGTGPQAAFSATSLSHAADLITPVVAAAERFDILPGDAAARGRTHFDVFVPGPTPTSDTSSLRGVPATLAT